jgi:tetratricopeptide (TPR) repeat protein
MIFGGQHNEAPGEAAKKTEQPTAVAAATTAGLVQQPSKPVNHGTAKEHAKERKHHAPPKDQAAWQKLAQLESVEEQAQAAFDSKAWANAEELYERCLELKERDIGAQNPLLVSTLARIIECLQKQDRQPDAREYLVRAETLYAHDQDKVPNDMHNWIVLGDASLNAESYGYAEQFYRRAIADCKAERGHDIPTLCRLLQSLGKVYVKEEKLEMAKSTVGEALGLIEKTEPNGPQYLSLVGQYTYILRRLGQDRMANQWMKALPAKARERIEKHQHERFPRLFNR